MRNKIAAFLIPVMALGSSLFADHNQADAAAISKGVIVKTVNFREKPSLSGDQVRYLKSGESVKLIDQVNSYWYKVEDKNGTVGYVSSQPKYIKVNTSSPQPNPSTNFNIDRIIQTGMKYLGTPYEFGSNRSTITTFDCSDFVRQAFKEGAGITLPADSRKQADYVKNIGNTTTNWRDLKPGDLMFFMSYEGSKKSDYSGINKSNQRITHDGIYLGEGKILHTYSKKSGGVRVDTIEGKHWEYRFVFGGSATQ